MKTLLLIISFLFNISAGKAEKKAGEKFPVTSPDASLISNLSSHKPEISDPSEENITCLRLMPSRDTSINEDPEQIVEHQLKAYNSRDLEAFLMPFSDSIEAYLFPDQPAGKGKNWIRQIYDPMFKQFPELHCQIKKRIVKGNYVIDHESITGTGQPVPMEAIVIYEIGEGKIIKMYMLQ